MDLLTSQTVTPPKIPNAGYNLMLQASPALEVRLAIPETDEELANQRAHRRIPFSRPDASLPVDVIRQ